MNKYYNNMLKFAVAILCLSNCVAQLKTCTDDLVGKEIVTVGASGNPLIFRLDSLKTETRELSCKNGENLLFFKQTEMQLMSIKNYNLPGKQLATDTMPDLYFTNNGMFGLKEGNDTHYYYPEEFCIMIKRNYDDYHHNGRHKRTVMGIRICKAGCEGNTPCIQKCCPMEEAFDLKSRNCQPTKLTWSPFLYAHENSKKFTSKSKFLPHYIHHVLQCPASQDDEEGKDPWVLYGQNIPGKDPIKRTKFKLLEDGSIVAISQRRKWSKLNTQHFCIDVMQNFSIEKPAIGSENEQIVFVCGENEEEQMPRVKSLVYSGIMYFASIFLLITCLYYIILWDEQNIHGWTIFSMVLSMFFMFFFLGTSNILRYISNTSKSTFRKSLLCTIVGILAHFSSLCTFTWLSFVNIDLFLNFGSVVVSRKKTGELSQYCVYATVAWSIPIFVIATGLILNYIYPDDESLIPVPDYGREVCFIVPSAQGVYLYYIVSFLLGINLLFITATFYNFYHSNKNTMYIRSNKSDSQKWESKTFVIGAKLFVVMGATWILEVISWMLTKEESDQAWYWYASDVYNLFQALLIFRIFVCKKTTAVRLQQKYPFCKKIFSSTKSKDPEKDPFVNIYKPIN